MNDAAAAATPTVPAATPGGFRSKWTVFILVFAVWAATLALAYAVSAESLGLAVLFIFLFGFPIPTFLFYEGRHVVTKRVVKALDYLTLLTFLTGIVAVAEIDTKTLKERADQAAASITDMQHNLQEQLNAQLQKCDNYQIKAQYKPDIFSRQFLQSFVFCYLLSDLRGVDLNTLSEEKLANRAYYSSLLFGMHLMPQDDDTRKTVIALEDYDRTRSLMKPANPIGAYISRSIAYLLVAFAFAVRLTRTTLEVFEWHT